MITATAKLSAKYLYVRCDCDFQLSFTNGSIMPFWKGFYCLLTEDLQKYNTNNDLQIQSEDAANIWWLSSDTLIMSVTDINSDTINLLAQMANSNLVANTSQTILLTRANELLQSLQNTLSTFLNTYVQVHSVVDYGFQTSSVSFDLATHTFDSKLYIAKPDGSYQFNCSLVFERAYSASNIDNYGVYNYLDSAFILAGGVGSSSYYVYAIGSQYTNLGEHSGVYYNRFNIPFALFANDNSQLSGFTVSNEALTYRLTGSGRITKGNYGQNMKVSFDVSEADNIFEGLTYVNGTGFYFDTKHGNSAIDILYIVHNSGGEAVLNTDPLLSGVEKFTINFDVSYTSV